MHQTLGRHELHGVPLKMNLDVLTFNSLNGINSFDIYVAMNSNK